MVVASRDLPEHDDYLSQQPVIEAHPIHLIGISCVCAGADLTNQIHYPSESQLEVAVACCTGFAEMNLALEDINSCTRLGNTEKFNTSHYMPVQ
jgi:hypothetical protein